MVNSNKQQQVFIQNLEKNISSLQQKMSELELQITSRSPQVVRQINDSAQRQDFHRPKKFNNGAGDHHRTITRDYVEKFENQNRSQMNKDRGGYKPKKSLSKNENTANAYSKKIFDYNSSQVFEN